MAIIINSETRVLVTGFTGRIGSFHAQDMINHALQRAVHYKGQVNPVTRTRVSELMIIAITRPP
ncbi:MAG: hypothetical protein AAFQ05_16050, partial [Pseudomonadota bacterium]